MAEDLEVIEAYLSEMFMPAFAKAVVDKQLGDIGETRETYDRTKLEGLLKRLETKVFAMKGPEALTITNKLRRRITAT